LDNTKKLNEGLGGGTSKEEEGIAFKFSKIRKCDKFGELVRKTHPGSSET
jgi:hypothetical protein